MPRFVFWTLDDCKVGIKINALIAGCKIDVTMKFSENDVKSLK